MNVLVTGGTGFIGRHLCEELHERGHDVTALSRDPDPDVVPTGVDLVEGDVTDRDSLDAPFEGKDAVVNLVALSPLWKPDGGEERHFEVHAGGTENVIRAAKQHGVDRLVQQSANKADPEGPTAYIRAKGRAEEIVRESDLEWVISRPSIIFGDGAEFVPFVKLVTTPYVTGLPGGGRTLRVQSIWVREFVPMLAAMVEDEARSGEMYEIGGPKVQTLAEVTRTIYRADGKSVRIVPIPMALANLGMTIADPIPFVPFGRNQYRGLKFDNTVADNDVDAFGVSENELTTFEAYLGLE